MVAFAADLGTAALALEHAGLMLRLADSQATPAALASLCAQTQADVVLLPAASEAEERAYLCRILPQPPAILALVQDEAALAGADSWADDALLAGFSDAALVHRLQHVIKVRRAHLQTRQAKRDLQASVQHLHTVFSVAPVGIAYCDATGNLILTNDTLRNLIGISEHHMASAYGKPVYACPVFGEVAHAFFKGEPLLEQELCFTGRDGQDCCMDVSGLPTLRDGKVDGVVLVFTDVTQRKRAEIAEQEQRRMAEALRATGTALARTLDSDAVMNLILANVGLVVPHRAANIMLVTGDEAHVVFSRGYSEEEQRVLDRAQLTVGQVPLFEQMIETQQPVVIADTHASRDWAWTGMAWVRSYLGAPILAYNRVVGFLSLDSDRTGAFSNRDVERLQAFTDQAAVAIENAQMFDAAYRDAHELRTLHRATSFLFASNVFTSDNLSEIARRIAETVVGEFGQVNCGVITVSEANSELVWLAQAGEYERAMLTTLFLDGPGLIPEAIRTGQVVYAPNVSLQPHYQASSPLTRSELVIPLRTTKGVYGALDMQSTDLDAFDEQDRHVLLAFAERAATAIENMRIYSDIQRRVRERTTELNRVKERAEAILNHSSDAILLMRADGRIQQTNRAFNSMFGFGPDEIYNRSFDALAGPGYADTLLQALLEVVATRSPQRIEVTALRHNGEAFEADVMMSPILPQHGDPVSSVVCSLRDITPRKQMERELRDALMKEREVSEFKSRFISRASHEFRTPLAMIATSSDLLKNYSERMTEAQRADRIDRIQTEIAHLTAMLDDLLNISKAQEIGPDSLHASPFDLAKLFDDTVEDMRSGLGMGHIFEVLRDEGPFEFVGERKLLRRALVNLISNALKYSEAGTRIRVQMTRRDDAVLIAVEDSGIGIPEADQKQLFEPFHRGANVAQIIGTGLGLAIVKQVVDLHGGEIAVQSAENRGSCFTITLPYAPEPAEVEV
ncbi:MAG TPA: ATP-binding protein [Candidatus Limnocylindrales bacterium]|nr:ATP-binding protein [Candidatus Limnocylindrales bacterium]